MTSGFLSTNLTAITPNNAGANSIFLTKLTPLHNATADAVVIDVSGSASSISFKVLIYDGSHSSLLAVGSTVTSLAAGYNRLPLTGTLSLTGGTPYYVGYVCNSSLNVSVENTGAGSSWYVNGGQSVSSPANPLSGGASNSNSMMIGLEFADAGQTFGWASDGTATISTNTVIAQCSSADFQNARSVITRSAASPTLSYAEVVCGGPIALSLGVGIVAVCMGMVDALSTQLYCEVVSNLGIQGTTNAGFDGVNSGDNIGIAYDSGGQQVWFRTNGGVWFGTGAGGDDPATSTAGLPVNPGNWPVTIFAGDATVGSPSTFYLLDTANLQQYAAPSGYSPWSSATAPEVYMTGAGATGEAGNLTTAYTTHMQIGQIQAVYWPVRIGVLFDGGSSGTDASVTGVEGTGAAGTPLVEIDKPVTGVSATGQIGIVTLFESINDSITIVGVFGTGAAGTPHVEVDESKSISGIPGTGAAGTPQIQISDHLPGASAAGQIGSVTLTAIATTRPRVMVMSY